MAIKQYSIEEIVPLPGYSESGANAINSNGVCVGASSGINQSSSVSSIWDSVNLSPFNPGVPGISSTANAISDDGTVVGHFNFSQTVHAYILPPGSTYDLLEPLTPDINVGSAQALGFGKEPVGWCESGANWQRVACMWDIISKRPTSLGLLQPADIRSIAYAGNKKGQIAGTSIHTGNVSEAFLWTPGGTQGTNHNPQMEGLGTLGGNNSRGFGINNLGQVVGESENLNGETHAFLWTRGGTNGGQANPQMEDLGVLPGHTSSTAIYINNNGQIFGSSRLSSSSAPLAFISDFPPVEWKEGPLGFPIPFFPAIQNRVMTELNTLIPPNNGWILRNAGRGNSKGEIVGWGEKFGMVRGFRMKPVIATGLGWPIISTVSRLIGSSIAAGGGGWEIDLVTGRIKPEPPPVPWMRLTEETRNQITSLIAKDISVRFSTDKYSSRIQEIINKVFKELENL